MGGYIGLQDVRIKGEKMIKSPTHKNMTIEYSTNYDSLTYPFLLLAVPLTITLAGSMEDIDRSSVLDESLLIL